MPLIEEYRDLRDKQRNKKDESAPKLEEIKKMRLQMKTLADDIKKKNEGVHTPSSTASFIINISSIYFSNLQLTRSCWSTTRACPRRSAGRSTLDEFWTS